MRFSKLSWLLPLAVVVVLASPDRVSAQMPRTSVFVAPVQERQVAPEQFFVGTVLPKRRAVIGSAVDGRVVELAADEGDRVEQDQPLVQLLTETIKLELEAAQAELEFRQQELNELENGTRPEELAQAKAKMLAAEASLGFAAARRDRATALYRDGRTIPKEDYDEAFSAAQQAEQAYLEAKAAMALAEAGPRKERIAQARAQVAMQQALVYQIEDRVKKHTIISRFDGFVVSKFTEQGAWVKRGDPVMEVVALDEVDVVVQVVEQHVPYIHRGSKVKVEVPALPGRTLEGTVLAVVPQADVRARTFPVRVRVTNQIENNQPLLRAGMYARAALPTGPRLQALTIPKDALVLGGPTTMVYVVDTTVDPPTVSPVPVQTGVAVDGWIQVQGNLQAGQQVVIEGNERLRPGQPVTILQNTTDAAANPS